MQCPKCHFEQAAGGAECLRCGVIFARLAEPPPIETPQETLAEEAPEAATEESPAGETLYRPTPRPVMLEIKEIDPAPNRRWLDLLLTEERGPDPFRFWARAALAALLFLWGWRFLLASVASNAVGESFLHWIVLPFHEAGHVLFAPFGDFLRTLGGSLMQLLVPALCCGTLLLRQRDPFGAGVALWWLGESFMDLGPYIADAQAGELTLLGGVTGRDMPGYHDWENILIDLDLLRYDQTLGKLTYGLGGFLMLAAFVWWAALLRRQWRQLREEGKTSPGGPARV